MYDTSTLPSPRLNHLPFKKEEKHQLGVSERVSACKGNENNRKVVSFPIIFFKKHKRFFRVKAHNSHKARVILL